MLEAQGLGVSYGGIRAVKGIDLTIAPGELVALIGANGAGKTTTLKALAGMLPWTAGTGRFAGQPLEDMPAHLRVRAGLVLVPEGRGVFARLTIAENLDMGAYIRNDAEIATDIEQMYTLFPRLKDRRTQLAGRAERPPCPLGEPARLRDGKRPGNPKRCFERPDQRHQGQGRVFGRIGG